MFLTKKKIVNDEVKELDLSDFYGSTPEKAYSFSKHARYIINEQKRLYDAERQSFEARKKLGKLSRFEKVIYWLEKSSQFSLHVVTFGVLGKRWE